MTLALPPHLETRLREEASRRGLDIEDYATKLIEEGLIPQQRWGTPEDVGKAVSALVGGAFNYSTGTIIEVSGGMNIRKL